MIKVYFAILGVFKISNLGYNYATILKLEKNWHFLEESKFEMVISSKKWNGNIFQNKKERKKEETL